MTNTPEEPEWPRRDAIPFVREAVVTAEMIEAGRLAFGYANPSLDYAAIYRAMLAHAPAELVSEGERIAVRERDSALAELAQARSDIEGFRSVRDTYFDKMERDAALITKLRAELQATHDALGQRPAPVPDTPKLTANPFREFGGDRRRVGGGYPHVQT